MSWGNKLLITFIVFASGMAYLVYRSMQTNFELVDKDYYKNELRYQEVIEATRHVNELGGGVYIRQDVEGIQVTLPAEMKGQAITGTVHFYCAYDAKKDVKLTLDSTPGVLLVPPGMVSAGHYQVKISWEKAGKKYFSETKMTIH